jgi:hypothetical protein
MSAPTPDEMLDWVAMFVMEINALESQGGEEIELIAADGGHKITVTRFLATRSGNNVPKAFRECVVDGMRQIPLEEPK